jgi:DNA repair exonuclease SbcCD nuclease subunit|tara:strand:- start:941 stop:1339 length:399 start_codon:yes stop_codon:yes gene_type:complete
MEENERPDIPENTEKHKIGLFHSPIEGCKTDLGFMFESGYPLEGFIGLDVVLAGDIHKRQTFDIGNNSKAYMVGSLIQQNFGETIKNHGYGVYELDNKVYNFIDVKSSSPYLSFKIKDITDIEKQKEKLLNV